MRACHRIHALLFVGAVTYTLIVLRMWSGINNQRNDGQHYLAQGNHEEDNRSYINSLWHVKINEKENKVIHVGMFGLGHRLSKLSAAHHLVQTSHWPVTHLEVLWGTCDIQTDNGMDIFTYLFGNNQIEVRHSSAANDDDTEQASNKTNNSIANFSHQGKSLVIRNDVVGYYAGQSFKNAQIPLQRSHMRLWQNKLDSDTHLFRNLVASFERIHGDQTTRKLQKQWNWDNHFVIGLHIRAGNGEQDHFGQAQRQIVSDGSTFYQNLARTIRTFLADKDTNRDQKPPLIFLATDTASVVNELRQLLASDLLPVVTVPQPRVEPHKGVSYSVWTAGSKNCWDGWLYSMVDMTLLARSDFLIATRRSTFTQILPRSLVLRSHHGDNVHRRGRHETKQERILDMHHRFCEVGEMADSMTCFSDSYSWLFRENHNDSSIATSSAMVPTTFVQSIASPSIKNYGNPTASVVHKVMVHFPDVTSGERRVVDQTKSASSASTGDYWWKQAEEFFDCSQTSEHRLLFGFKIDKTYRQFKVFIKGWTVIE